MKVSEIKIKKSFKDKQPSVEKMNTCRKYYSENGKLDRDIIVDSSGYLIDGYVGYLVLIENSITDTEIIISDKMVKPLEKTKRKYYKGKKR